MGGCRIGRRDAVLAVIGAANRDPEKFPDPDCLDLARADNSHLAFAYGAHYCFGAPLARMESQIMFRTLLRRTRNLALVPGPSHWRNNTTFRGLETLPVTFDAVQ
jgi:cytochrome P450